MHRSHTNIFAFILLLSVLVLIFPMGSFGQDNEANDPFEAEKTSAEEKYSDPNLSLDEAVMLYHATVNAIFNSRMERLFNKEEPEELTQGVSSDEHCQNTPDSLRTYCLAIYLADEYQGYARALLARKTQTESETAVCANEDYEMQKAEIEAKLNEPDVTPGQRKKYEDKLERWNNLKSNYIAAKSSNTLENSIFIDRELELAGQTLDQALAAYNEFLLAQPMHVQYQEMIKHLEKYRDGLANIRKEVGEFPSKFVNATSTECT